MKTSGEDSSDKETGMKMYALIRSGTHDTSVSSAKGSRGRNASLCVCYAWAFMYRYI